MQNIINKLNQSRPVTIDILSRLNVNKTPKFKQGIKVKDYVHLNPNYPSEFDINREYIISTREYIFFNCYNDKVLELPVIRIYIDSKERLHIIC